MPGATKIDTAKAHVAGSPPRFFYGWVLVGVTMVLLSIGTGTSIYMYSVVAGAVGEAFGASRFMLMMGSTGMLLSMAVVSPLLGTLLDRYPNRWVLMAGAGVMGIGFVLISVSTHIWHVILAYVLFIGVGLGTLGLLAVSTLLARWFVRNRGLAVGIAALGTQLGGFVYPPIIAAIMDVHDWRIAIGSLGIFILLVVPVITYLFVVDHPREKNLWPDGDPPHRDQPGLPHTSEAADDAPFRLKFVELFTHRNFLLLVLIIGAASATSTVVISNLALFATDLGEPVVRGAFLVSLVAVLGMFISPLAGWLCDVVNLRVVTAAMMLTLATGCLVYSMATSYSLLLLATFFQGVAAGVTLPLWASVVGRLFAGRVYGQVMGSTMMVVMVVTATAPPLAGWLHDLTGSYRLLFLTLLAVLCVLTVLIVMIRIPRTDAEKFGAAPS